MKRLFSVGFWIMHGHDVDMNEDETDGQLARRTDGDDDVSSPAVGAGGSAEAACEPDDE